MIAGMVVNGFINVVITTIEKRFGLTSSQTGLIAGGYDIASFLLLIPVSYLGGRSSASKPRSVCVSCHKNIRFSSRIFAYHREPTDRFEISYRYIGVGVLVLGLGNLLFASPHYLAANYRGGQRSEQVCRRVTNATSLMVIINLLIDRSIE